jgi:predicted AlkP superfamily pyrophosphatase or phosphodiesterase
MRAFLFLFCWSLSAVATPVKEKPNLVLVLVFDQFRADTLTRFESRFLPAKQKNGKLGGFRYLMERGAYYPLAQHGVLQNMTCPGHAAVLTGAYPYQHGIATNDWYDTEKQKSVYCVEDGSPRYLVGSTYGDELKNSGLKSKVVTVSIKDRAAILLGGHRADLAIWMPDSFAKSAESMRWVSSPYYLPKGKTPKWMDTLNENLEKEKGRPITWTATGAGSGHSSLVASVEPLPKVVEGFGTQFPHEGTAGSTSSVLLPFGVEKTEEAAEAAFTGERLGQGKDPDVLAVSFSTHDFLGHLFGPTSREQEEMTVVEDQYVAKLLNFIESNVKGGLKKTVVVMTADHGAGPSPEWLQKNGYAAAERIDEKIWRGDINAFLNEKYRTPSLDWISDSVDLNIYLNRKILKDRNLEVKDVAAQVADFLQRTKKQNVAYAFTEADVRSRHLPPALHETQILRTFYPGRSGDVVVMLKPYQIVGHSTATHMTGYSYDRTVPILFAGTEFRPGIYSQAAQVIDIAPTLSFITGTTPPSGSEGRVLSEALKN